MSGSLCEQQNEQSEIITKYVTIQVSGNRFCKLRVYTLDAFAAKTNKLDLSQS